mmetsp:Transcript_51638/g.120891  ORF Transcript_51638/g.120891 Transcript_51638/m.120891 type:complete len:246 (-) Transcript_51638:771-1508(-)
MIFFTSSCSAPRGARACISSNICAGFRSCRVPACSAAASTKAEHCSTLDTANSSLKSSFADMLFSWGLMTSVILAKKLCASHALRACSQVPMLRIFATAKRNFITSSNGHAATDGSMAAAMPPSAASAIVVDFVAAPTSRSNASRGMAGKLLAAAIACAACCKASPPRSFSASAVTMLTKPARGILFNSSPCKWPVTESTRSPPSESITSTSTKVSFGASERCASSTLARSSANAEAITPARTTD